MIGLLCFVLAVMASPFKSKLRLEAENAVLRHQLIVLRRKLRGRVLLANSDRWFFVQLYRWFPSILQVLTIIRPATLVRWHPAGFRCYWRWKSRPLGGRPQIETELRVLIRQMSVENPLWGAPRIHGELLKLGFEVAQSQPRMANLPAQSRVGYCRDGPVRCPDYRFRPALCLCHRPARPQRAHLDQRHNKPDSGASPWQNGFAERLIGSIRRECVDHIIVLGEAHLRRVLQSYADYYNSVRTHRSLNKGAPVSRPVQRRV
jgi:hypothetical protein